MSIQGNNGAPNKRTSNQYNGDRIPFSDRTNENGKIDKSSRRKFDPSRGRTFEERSQVNKEDIESLKNATHQSIIEQNLRSSQESRESREAEEKTNIRRRSPQLFDPYRRGIEDLSDHSLDSADHQAKLQLQEYRRKARERWEDEIRRETAPLVNGTGNNEIDAKHSPKGDSLNDRSNSPSDHTKSPLDPVRQAAVERMQKLENNPEAVVYLYQGEIHVFENFDSAKEKAKFGENTINKLDELERRGRGHTVEGVRYIDVEDGINGIRRFGLELVNVPEVEKPQDRQSDAIETERLSKIKPTEKRVTFAPNLEEVRFFNHNDIIQGEQNEGIPISSKDGEDAESNVPREIARKALKETQHEVGLEDPALQNQTVRDFVGSSRISEVPEWMHDRNLGDFRNFDNPHELPNVEHFTRNFQDNLHEYDTNHEGGEYSARERRAHDQLITLLGVKQAEKLRLVAQEHLGSSELHIDSTRIAKIRFYAYESREGDLLFTNRKYTEQDYADRGLKPVSLDYAVEKLEYLEAQGAVKWKLPKTYAIRSETNLGGKVVVTYDQQLAREMITNHGYKELMPGARDGIDLSDRDDPAVDEEVRDNIRKKFDESEDGIKLAKLKKKFDEFSDKLSKRFSEEEVEKRIPKLEEDYDYDYARENIVTQLYFDEMIKKNKLPLSERWEYKMWYREATQPLEKALDDMGREYYRSSLENNKKGSDILKLEDQFKASKNRLKSNANFSEVVKALSKELAKKRRQYIEARLETEEPNEKSNKALKRIQKHLEKGIEAMKAMEEPLSQGEKEQNSTDKINSSAKRFSDLITSMAPEGYKAKYEEAANDFFKKSKPTNKDIDAIEENKEAIGEMLSKNRDNLQKWIAELSKQLPPPSQDGPYAEGKDLLDRESPIRHGGIIGA